MSSRANCAPEFTPSGDFAHRLVMSAGIETPSNEAKAKAVSASALPEGTSVDRAPTDCSTASAGREFDFGDLERAYAAFDETGYVIFERVLSAGTLQDIRNALKPFIDRELLGRNEFEGLRTNRIYAMLAKAPVFADLVTHPLAMAFVRRDLGADALLSACLAINLHPGETAQPWHFDDSHYQWPRPRPSLGVSAFWAIDPLTDENGATEVIPGSHLWESDEIEGAVAPADFKKAQASIGQSSIDQSSMDQASIEGARADGTKALMPAGSLMLAKGTLWHRGGANRSDASRLLITPQYCPGWTRPLENMSLAVPPAIAKDLPPEAQALLGYSIHAPFMGYVDGRHPKRVLD
ncbi:MAG: phytanoyl-CoA dioxygenase family protein [Pseudomonadota bacterium]